MKNGFTIFFAMLVGSLALAVGAAIYDLTVRELDLSQSATQSQYAIYAADTGAECGLYWDNKASSLNGSPSVFGTSTTAGNAAPPTSGVNCNGQDVAALGTPPVNGYTSPPQNTDPTVNNRWTAWDTSLKGATYATTTFYVDIPAPPQSYCAKVSVGKYTDVNGVLYTTVVSRGYNTCTETSGVSRVERVLQISY
jgi:hypothetical protein